MRRDVNAFRERFKRWQAGELVYDRGLVVHAAIGLDGEELTNVMAYYPKEDYFTGPSAVMPEINVTRKRDGKTYVSLGQQKEPTVKRPYFISSRTGLADFGDIANMAHIVGFGLLPGASDVEDAANVAQDVSDKNYLGAGIGAGLFFVPNIIEKPVRRFGKFVKNIFKREVPIKTDKDWLSEVTDEEISQYIDTHPKHLEDRSLFVVGAENMPSGLSISGKSREDLARLAVAREHYRSLNPDLFIDLPFGGRGPLENFMARNNITLNDVLSEEMPFQKVLDRLIMKPPSLTKWQNLINSGIVLAYHAAGGNKAMLGPDDIDDLIYDMAKGDPFALSVRENMIRDFGGGFYSPELDRIVIGKNDFRRYKVDGIEQIGIPDLVKYAHEYGHLLSNRQNTAQQMKKEIADIRKDLKDKGLNDGIADVTGFDPELVGYDKDYLIENYFDEILQRVSLWKDAIGIRDANVQLTGGDVRKMMKDYVRTTGVDNNISSMIRGIVDPDKFAKFFSKYAKAAIPATVLTGLSAPKLLNNEQKLK